MHCCPVLAQLFPLIHLRLHSGHLNSPKHLFLPWYGVSPSPFGLAWNGTRIKIWKGLPPASFLVCWTFPGWKFHHRENRVSFLCVSKSAHVRVAANLALTECGRQDTQTASCWLPFRIVGWWCNFNRVGHKKKNQMITLTNRRKQIVQWTNQISRQF